MSLPPGTCRVSARRRCPVCGHDHWCLVALDGSIALCHRVESKVLTKAGFRHVIDEAKAASSQIAQQTLTRKRFFRPDVLMSRYQGAVVSSELEAFAHALHVEPGALYLLEVGRCCQLSTWAFPMRDGSDAVIGIRLRNDEGRKWAVTGSRSGLFYPVKQRPGDMLVVCEGPTDTAAMLSIGVDTVGRPDATNGHEHLIEYVRRFPRHVVVLADADHVGLAGAARLANAITGIAQSVRVMQPGLFKDARDWVKSGLTRQKFIAAAMGVKKWVKNKEIVSAT